MRVVVVVMLALGLAGCMRPVGSVQTGGSSGPVVVQAKQLGTVAVRAATAEAEPFARDVEFAIRSKLEDRRVFAGMPVDPAYADVLLDVSVLSVRDVTRTARILVGAMAGRASVVADVKVIERKTGAVLGEMKATGQSSGGSTYAGTTQEAFDQLAVEIADYLLANRKL